MPDFYDKPFIKWLRNALKSENKTDLKDPETKYLRREKLIVFLAAYIMAMSLWLIVNLNGSFNINLNVPVEVGNIPENMSLTEKFPEFVQVGLSGEGWQLFSLYNDPPSISINVGEGDVNLFEQVRQRLSYLQGIDISKVQPLLLSVDMEPKVSKKVPVVLHTELKFEKRYGVVGQASLVPDSITVTGAESLVADITEWEIEDTLKLEEIRENISKNIPLQKEEDDLIEISQNFITFSAQVSEFTEGQSIVYIRTRNLPRGQNINYNPSSVTIKYDVPLSQYAEVSRAQPYEVYVPYSKILEDSSGFVTPDIELKSSNYDLRLRSFQPKAVAYFSVLEES